MLLAVDVGNTNVVVGVFKGEQLLAKWHLFTDIYKTADEYTVLLRNLLADKSIDMDDINGAIVSCVAPQLLYIFEGLCKRSFGFRPLIVGTGIRTGVKLNYDNPREVGADRVVNAVAAHHLYKQQLIVIDFGTATSLEVVSADGDFLGGAVAPGIGISAEALFKQTAMLPRVELHSPEKAIGKNTISAMQSGLIYGYVGLIEGLVERMKRELDGDVKVIATGGLAPTIARETSVIDEVIPELTLVGLRLIYQINVEHPQRKRGAVLQDKNIILGVTGSISVYKAVDLASKLIQAGAVVDVVMTEAATEFVKPISFGSLTKRPVITEMFPDKTDYNIAHISLSDRADLVVICPATANTIAKLANGIADDMLSCTVLATEAPVIVAPAMNYRMYRNKITQQNIDKLKGRGFVFMGPDIGRLASGAVGKGRLTDIAEILGSIKQVLGQNGDLFGKRIVVTAGGTQEPIDPVRRVSNRSSGKMGYALAEAARDRGASVVLVSATTSLDVPYGVELVLIETAQQMHDAVAKSVAGADALIMAAAVADYRPRNISGSKIKKSNDSLNIEMEKTVDILSDVDVSVKVGFAAESDDLESNAREKLSKKNLDFIVANDITAENSGFDSETNEVMIIDKSGQKEKLPLMPKIDVAHKILDRVAALVSK